jgi:hypothetical protein
MTYKVTGPLYLTNNAVYDFGGSTIHGVGDFRVIYSTNIHNTTVRNLNITHSSGSTGQASFHTTNCYNMVFEHVVSTAPALNSFEFYSSSNIVLRVARSQSPTWFGIFHFNSTDCVVEDCAVDSTGSFSVEPKSSKRIRYTRLRITNPLAEHAFTSWTGFGTAPEVPGPKLNEDITIEDIYVRGSATGKNLIDINATRNVVIRGGILERSTSGWAPLNIASSFFYNEGSNMTGDVSAGSTNIVNVTAANQLMAGSRIHLAGSATNHTVYSVVGTTVALTANSDITGTGVLLGFVATPSNITVNGLHIIGGSSGNGDNIDIGGTAGDPLGFISLDNVTSDTPNNYGLSVSYAPVSINGGSFRNAVGMREINAIAGARVFINGTRFNSATNITSYACVVQNGASVYAVNPQVFNMGVGAFVAVAHGDVINVFGGMFSNILTAPIILWDNSSVVGATFINNLIGLGSFNADVRLEGTNNTVAHNHFFLGAAASTHDSYIKEQSTNATLNAFIGNTFEPSLTTFDNVALSAGSTSIRVSVPDTRLNAITATSITNTTLTASQFVGTDANKNLITITNPILDAGYSSAWNGDGTNAPSRNSVYDKIEALTAAAAGTNSVLVNGSIVTNPNLQDGTKSFWSVSGSTNVVNVATNITANQITDATITYAKVQNISATKRVLGRNTAGAGVSEEVTLSQLLDWTGSAAQGDVLYRGAATWALLPAGTSGQVLATQGAAANPHWVNQSASGAALVGTMINSNAVTAFYPATFYDTSGTNVQDALYGYGYTTATNTPARGTNFNFVGNVNLPSGTATIATLVAPTTTVTSTLAANTATANGLTVTNTSTLNVANIVTETVSGTLTIPNSAAPTTSSFGVIAADNNAWAASHGTIQFFDGTANVYAIAAQVSDTPTAGQVPKFNANGTITWENDNGTSDNWLPSGGTDSTLAGTGFANAMVLTNSLTIQGGSSAGTIMLFDSIGSGGGKGVRLTAPTTQSTNINFILPDRPSIGGSGGQGLMVVTVTAVTNLTTSITNTLAGIETALGSVNIIDQTEIDTSAELRSIVTDETGSGQLVFGTGPTITDLVLAGTFKLTTGTSVTTSSAGMLAFDSDAWAANRGAVQVYDGTANTYLLGTLVSSTPIAGQVPKWQSNGTIIWATDDGSSASISDTAFAASWDGVTTVAPSKNAVYDAIHRFDSDDDGRVDVIDASGAGIIKVNVSGVPSIAVQGTDYTTDISTNSFTNKTFDGSATGNTIKFKNYLKLSQPRIVDGAGCTFANTNNVTSPTFMLPQFSGSAATNANYCRFSFRVPKDLDNTVDLVATLSLRIGGGTIDHSGQTYHVGMWATLTSEPIESTGSNWTTFTMPADVAGDDGDYESINNVTLTNWKDNLGGADQWVTVEVRRDGANDASVQPSYLLELEIEYGVTQ